MSGGRTSRRGYATCRPAPGGFTTLHACGAGRRTGSCHVRWHVATNPRSPFTRRPYLQRTTGERHLALDGAVFTETLADGTVTAHTLDDETEVRRVVDEEFGIVVPEGVRLLG
ncbi:arylamine N-acetyltransferase [Streptomyces sp. NPDC048663]|uniref:arylamine N-acetyltransferase n=1 Tax=Streptomyces sp. NPDC048663 TaxID=3155638 RepID=UPI003416CBF9